jgi:hypothetical protein
MSPELGHSSRRRDERCLSDLELDRLLLGELAGTPEEARARGHLAECSPCADRFQALELARQSFRSPLPPRLSTQRRSPPRRLAWAVASAALAVAAGFVLVTTSSLDGSRLKGGNALALVVRHPDGHVERVLPGADLHPGDGLRFEVSTQQRSYVLIIGLDASGQVTLYFPSSGPPTPLAPASHQLLPGSVLLDETLGPERIFALYCAAAPSLASAIEAGRKALLAQQGHPERVLRLDSSCRQASFLLEKKPSP